MAKPDLKNNNTAINNLKDNGTPHAVYLCHYFWRYKEAIIRVTVFEEHVYEVDAPNGLGVSALEVKKLPEMPYLLAQEILLNKQFKLIEQV